MEGARIQMNDTDYMELALELAKKGQNNVSPNPMVGAVIVKNEKIIGTGYHEVYGGPHAEINALSSCTESPKGASMYVTLEPCCHYGKQPPCTNAIIEAGISHVIAGCTDPNPKVSGHGIHVLQEHGIHVTTGVLHDECEKVNEVFFHYTRTHTPFVVMKYAMTMDGKIATCTGESKWITGDAARKSTHLLRSRYRAIMAGIGTVLADDPLLNCRLCDGRDPIRIICDTTLRTPVESNLIRTADTIPTILATCSHDAHKQNDYRKKGCRILTVPKKENHVDLQKLMELLGAEGIDSILLEGGAELNWAALREGIVQKTAVYIAPKLFGGTDAKTPIEGKGISAISETVMLNNSVITNLGEDILIESEVISNVHGNH